MCMFVIQLQSIYDSYVYKCSISKKSLCMHNIFAYSLYLSCMLCMQCLTNTADNINNRGVAICSFTEYFNSICITLYSIHRAIIFH